MIVLLRTKITAGFALLIGLLVIAGVISVIEFQKMSHTLETILQNNYASIAAANTMLDAMEMQNIEWLNDESSREKNYNQNVHVADSIMKLALKEAQGNITETNEGHFVQTIENEYTAYQALVATWLKEKPEASAAASHTESEMLKSQYKKTKKAISDLLYVNQKSMYDVSFQRKENLYRALMPVVVSLIGAITLAILLNFFIIYYYVNPLNRLVKGTKNVYFNSERIDAGIITKNELKTLEDEINALIDRIKQSKTR